MIRVHPYVFFLLAALCGLSVAPAYAATPFLYTFNSSGILDEAGSLGLSSSPYWWLNSGGQVVIKDGVGSTLQGPVKTGAYWQKMYAAANPLDTQGGLFPQNLFRLISKRTWTDPIQEIQFKLSGIHTTDTPNRGGFSGLLFMSRYQNSNNLYYAGIRMDGHAVIKKKKDGVYTTLAEKKVFAGTYDRATSPNLIPIDQWMKLKSTVITNSAGAAVITLALDRANSGAWEQLLSFTDSTDPLLGAGSIGIRSDYMDVFFENYKVSEL